jgi:hypothetical protein
MISRLVLNLRHTLTASSLTTADSHHFRTGGSISVVGAQSSRIVIVREDRSDAENGVRRREGERGVEWRAGRDDVWAGPGSSTAKGDRNEYAMVNLRSARVDGSEDGDDSSRITPGFAI